MELSAALEHRLIDTYERRARNPSEAPLGFTVGGQWYCPGCAVPTIEAVPGVVQCPRCERSLSEFIFELVELHPHLPPNTSLSGRVDDSVPSSYTGAHAAQLNR
jgi:hypothetical protein